MGSTPRRVWYELPDGSATASHELVETPSGWVQPSPVLCPNGHRLTAGRTRVSYQPCATSADHGGHITYTCAACRAAAYIPPRLPGCNFVTFDERRIGP